MAQPHPAALANIIAEMRGSGSRVPPGDIGIPPENIHEEEDEVVEVVNEPIAQRIKPKDWDNFVDLQSGAASIDGHRFVLTTPELSGILRLVLLALERHMITTLTKLKDARLGPQTEVATQAQGSENEG